MKSSKTILKSVIVLRNLITLQIGVYNETRWSGKVYMLRRFIEIRDELIKADAHPDSDEIVESTASFLRKKIDTTVCCQKLT